MDRLDFKAVRKAVFYAELDWHCGAIDDYSEMTPEDKVEEKRYTEHKLRMDLAAKNLDELLEALSYYGYDKPERYILDLLIDDKRQDDIIEL